MNNETRHPDLILAEERGEVRDDRCKTRKKHEILALRRKMDDFESHMASIRSRLTSRQELASLTPNLHLPAVNSPFSAKILSIGTTKSRMNRLKLPLLQQIEHTRELNAPPKDPFLTMENVLFRTINREMYEKDANTIADKELFAVAKTKEAQELGEEARKRMIIYTQNESGWKFEERTSRYQQVMESKQQAEKVQQDANLQCKTIRQMKTQLLDPYAKLRSISQHEIVRPLVTLSSQPSYLPEKLYDWVWVLASPSTKLSFTPRTDTPDCTIKSEKELSMYILYYIAASTVNRNCFESEEQWETLLSNDCPPLNGWICCSVHGVSPAPELITIRSGIQTFRVVNAGVGHLNGNYVACGLHDKVKSFKSSAGVELFRKCVPIASVLSQVLHSNSVNEEQLCEKVHIAKRIQPGVVLPSGLAFIEKEELKFQSMQRIGSWLSMNEASEKNRRMIASRSTNIKPQETVKLDGDSVMNQISRDIKDTSDITSSRPEMSSSLCREWVLFTKCSRFRADKTTSGVNEPLVKGIGLGCLKRHYFISLQEKIEMTKWVQTKESWLEKNVLGVIIEREAQMERVYQLSRKCMIKYQQNLRLEMETIKLKLFAELNRVRFLSVKVLETIDRWRQHARKIGFARYDNAELSSNSTSQETETEASLLGWSSSITLETGKQLYNGSKAFISKIKRFRRSEDFDGKKEQHIVYLGYFATQEEAERAYDEHAATEARRLNTTVERLPHRRNVFRSCGKHFAVESEQNGPSFCIECKTKQVATLSATSEDEWLPPFFYGPGVNYIMKMANDLDFLDHVLPLKEALNRGHGVQEETFPMLGNVFLLPKTPLQDPNLAIFTTFPTPTAPRLGESIDSLSINDIDEEALDRERIVKAQYIFLQELQIYQPELIPKSLSGQNQPHKSLPIVKKGSNVTLQYRIIEALYWDHCAALKIRQERPLLALRKANIWCRPDVGEWASLVIRGAHQLHFLFEEKLEKAGKEMIQNRQQVLTALRQLHKVPLYFVPSRSNFTELIAAGQSVRGDVVQLEVNNVIKRLQRYDLWCSKSLVVQRWVRGVFDRRKARATRKALRFACKLRNFYVNQVAAVAKTFYCDVHAVAVQKAYKNICTPVYTRVVMMDGELVTITFHSLRHYESSNTSAQSIPAKNRILVPSCCVNCARRFLVRSNYHCQEKEFKVFNEVCTCSLNGGKAPKNSESWLIRAYNSSHNVIYRLRLDTAQLQQLISSQTLTKRYQRSQISANSSLIMDMEMKHLAAIGASKSATFYSNRAEKAAKTLSNWRRMNSEATQTRKSLKIALEKQLLLFERTKEAHFVAVGNAKKALDFTSRPFSQAQAWDPLENANDWRFIVEKRQLSKQLEEIQQEVERLRVAHFQATSNDQFTRANAAYAQDEYTNFWLPLVERESQIMEEAILLETTAKIRMESVMAQLCSRFLTLRDGFFAPIRRNLVLQSPLWHDMKPFQVDIPGLRRRLNHLRRRTLVLTNLAEEKRKKRRMIVTVSMWPLVAHSSHNVQAKRDFWVSAYDPIDCSMHNIFLEWELVQLLTGAKGRKIMQNSASSKRFAWRAIADILLSLMILDRFTDEVTLQKLQFYHTMRRLSPQFLSSSVMRDLANGRKCGQGDEILRQVVAVDGRLCVVVVYENWGDLTCAIYHSASGEFFRLVLLLREIFDLLSEKPLMLRLWIYCVKSNSYTPTLLTYLLKNVKFYKNQDKQDDIRIERCFLAQKRIKRYQTLLCIQNRKLLVSISEDSSGDFYVFGYDLKDELPYKLLLEREGLHRALKKSVLTEGNTGKSQFQTSSSLLLRKNRKLLFEWICSRLRFQSMLEHPELVTSGTSPLRFGLHVRESFRIFNNWIESSPRNPLSAVEEDEIVRRAANVDAAAFSSLQFDQLTLIDHSQLPFELEKEYVGTLDWVQAVVGQSFEAQEWRKELPHMRMDFFVKAHTLFARVRGELEAETIERRKRENWTGMEQEDLTTLCLDITSLLKSVKEDVLFTWQKLSILHESAMKWMNQWRKVHSELKSVTKRDDESNICSLNILSAVNSVGLLQEDSVSMFLDLLSLWLPNSTTDLVQFISLATPFDSYGPVFEAASLLHVCLQKWELELKFTVNNLELTVEKILRSENGLEELRKHKSRVVNFCNFLRRKTSIALNCEDEEIHEIVDVNHDKIPVLIAPEETTAINTGILIPCNNDEPFQEVFLADMPAWTPLSTCSFETHAQTMVKTLRSFFQQQFRQQQLPNSRFGHRSSNGKAVLTCQRVPYGLLVYQTIPHDIYTTTQLSQVNSRADGLTGGVGVIGPALFWPLQGNSTWYQRLLDCSVVYMELALNSEELELQEEHFKHPAAVRSTKYLPWKQFAIERLRVARTVKRTYARDGVCMDLLAKDAVEIEKNERFLTSVSIDVRQLEISLGKCTSQVFLGKENVTKSLSHCFMLQKDWLKDGSVKWRVSLANPRTMHQVLDFYDIDGRALQIPHVGYEDNKVVKIKKLQVEIDDIVKPRRLIFSCTNPQTHQKYFVDCDFYCLQTLLRQRNELQKSVDEAKCRQRSAILTIQEWRKLAVFAAQLLVFRTKNGVLSLCLQVNTSEVLPSEKFKVEVGQNPIVRVPVQRKCRADMIEERKTVERTLVHLFLKHQPAIRAATCGKMLAKTAGIGVRTASEWMQMTREDWRAQELRGILVLDANVLTSLEKAYIPATRHAREYLKLSRKEDDLGGLELQLKEIGKLMGETEIQSNAVDNVQSIRMTRWKRRGKEASLAAKRAEAQLVDVAEWWRRRPPVKKR